MLEGTPSATAQRVAAYRVAFGRLPTDFGDAGTDERLSMDVAESLEFARRERFGRYLELRTAFFDRVVVNALERGVGQVAVIGAGYDGRSLRYAKPGVRWFEVDHPATQADKRARLERLGVDPGTITFLPADLADGGLDTSLLDAGWEPEAPSLTLCEGVAIYLDPQALEALLTDLRTLATVGSRLATSFSPHSAEPGRAEHRARFRAAIEALGEPPLNSLSDEETTALLARARWRPAELTERSRSAGFSVAVPVWRAAISATRPTVSRVGSYLDGVWGRQGLDRVAGHLTDAYGIDVTSTRELDVGVVKVTRRDGPPWVARVFQAQRPHEAAQGDAEILRLLADHDFPAERLAHSEPITTLEGQSVLVTEFVDGTALRGGEAGYRLLGETVGRLVTLAGSDAITRPGGAWHHLCFQGNPTDEIASLRSLIDASAPRVSQADREGYDAIREAAGGITDCDGLPEALIHPDVVPPNAKVSPDGHLTLVDWTGAGRGPRLWPLAFLLWSAGTRYAEAAMSGYLAHAELEAEELQRLPEAIAARALVFEGWMFATGRKPLPDVVKGLPAARNRAAKIAARARRALA